MVKQLKRSICKSKIEQRQTKGPNREMTKIRTKTKNKRIKELKKRARNEQMKQRQTTWK